MSFELKNVSSKKSIFWHITIISSCGSFTCSLANDVTETIPDLLHTKHNREKAPVNALVLITY